MAERPDRRGLQALCDDYAGFEAPMGKYGWLNQLIYAGTVAPGDAKVPAVRLAIYKLV